MLKTYQFKTHCKGDSHGSTTVPNTNNFFDPYLPIYHTTFMALRFVLRPFAV